MVQVNQLEKKYTVDKQTITAVNNVSFSVNPGELFGIIGPDGAGKTSLFRMLVTLLLPTAGNATVAGMDIVKDYAAIRNKIGYMPGRFSLYQDLTVEENLQFFATIFNTTVAENYALIKEIYEQIAPFKDRKAGKLSGGMKQKLALSCALIHKPEVLFLDEPTTGVDAVSRKEFWEMLRRLQQQGITILVSTPYMDEASMCNRVALMQNGQLLTVNTPQQINTSFGKPLWAVKAAEMHVLRKIIQQWQYLGSCYSFGNYFHVTPQNSSTDIRQLQQYLLQNGIADAVVTPIEAGIEDCFMALMTEHA